MDRMLDIDRIVLKPDCTLELGEGGAIASIVCRRGAGAPLDTDYGTQRIIITGYEVARLMFMKNLDLQTVRISLAYARSRKPEISYTLARRTIMDHDFSSPLLEELVLAPGRASPFSVHPSDTTVITLESVPGGDGLRHVLTRRGKGWVDAPLPMKARQVYADGKPVTTRPIKGKYIVSFQQRTEEGSVGAYGIGTENPSASKGVASENAPATVSKN